MSKIWFPRSITFLSAFLLFQIELIIAKVLLPLYGGSYAVWGACVVFFQAVLLLGYFYAHVVIQKIGIDRYRFPHTIISFVPLLTFPGRSLKIDPAYYPIPLVIKIFWQLLLSIGLVFFILSTMSIIWQSWLENSNLPERSNPYALYAVSNFGSLTALLTYPFLFELFFELNTQLMIWRLGYLCLLVLQIIAFFIVRVSRDEQEKLKGMLHLPRGQIGRWFLLGAVSVILFLAVTNIITMEISPMPLLWVMPLSIYLISFTLNFKHMPWCPRWILENIHWPLGLSVLFYFFIQQGTFPLILELIFCYGILFILCMYCQNELIRTKPSQQGGLTLFYLTISLGSFAGGIFVSWIIPLITTSYSEFLVGLILLCWTMVMGERKQKLGPYEIRLMIYPILFLVFWPIAFSNTNIFGLLLIVVVFKFIYSELKKNRLALLFAHILILIYAPLLVSFWSNKFEIYSHRDYYGMFRVFDYHGTRLLQHGITVHGAQYLAKDEQNEPLAYYHRRSPVGKVMTSPLFHFHRMAMVGLGAGALAAYAQEDQGIDFLELNQDIVDTAQRYFFYLKKSKGKINYIIGDARVSLTQIPDRKYDFLVMDAFNGDAIPTHLLTEEAFDQYHRVLNVKGIILFHLSNRYLDLGPVVSKTAYNRHAFVAYQINPQFSAYEYSSKWLAVTWDKDNFQKLISQLHWQEVGQDKIGILRSWTDQYTNILSAVNVNRIVSELKNF